MVGRKKGTRKELTPQSRDNCLTKSPSKEKAEAKCAPSLSLHLTTSRFWWAQKHKTLFTPALQKLWIIHQKWGAAKALFRQCYTSQLFLGRGRLLQWAFQESSLRLKMCHVYIASDGNLSKMLYMIPAHWAQFNILNLIWPFLDGPRAPLSTSRAFVDGYTKCICTTSQGHTHLWSEFYSFSPGFWLITINCLEEAAPFWSVGRCLAIGAVQVIVAVCS
jgi:hypothetical protein